MKNYCIDTNKKIVDFILGFFGYGFLSSVISFFGFWQGEYIFMVSLGFNTLIFVLGFIIFFLKKRFVAWGILSSFLISSILLATIFFGLLALYSTSNG